MICSNCPCSECEMEYTKECPYLKSPQSKKEIGFFRKIFCKIGIHSFNFKSEENRDWLNIKTYECDCGKKKIRTKVKLVFGIII